MTVALITMVKDEADIIEFFLRHSIKHVDQIYVADHGSTDGTREKIAEGDVPVTLSDITDPGYWQSKYMTELAMKAMEDGHQWAVAADVDECWYVQANLERRIASFLDGLGPDVQIVGADLYHHIPTADDESKQRNPMRRIGWRKREPGALPKVCVRLHQSLVIRPGNHGATYQGAALQVPGLCVRHFSWRSPEQFVRKIRNGIESYSHTNLPPGVGEHWRMWEGKSDEAIIDQFNTWFYSQRPKHDRSLIYDPAPIGAALQA
jgi:hypothetical protein